MDLLQRYSNNPAYLVDVRTALKAVAKDDPTDDEPPLGGGLARTAQPRSTAARLGADTVHEMVDLFERGASMRELAEKYGTSHSSIKRLLYARGVRRRARPSG